MLFLPEFRSWEIHYQFVVLDSGYICSSLPFPCAPIRNRGQRCRYHPLDPQSAEREPAIQIQLCVHKHAQISNWISTQRNWHILYIKQTILRPVTSNGWNTKYMGCCYIFSMLNNVFFLFDLSWNAEQCCTTVFSRCCRCANQARKPKDGHRFPVLGFFLWRIGYRSRP